MYTDIQYVDVYDWILLLYLEHYLLSSFRVISCFFFHLVAALLLSFVTGAVVTKTSPPPRMIKVFWLCYTEGRHECTIHEKTEITKHRNALPSTSAAAKKLFRSSRWGILPLQTRWHPPLSVFVTGPSGISWPATTPGARPGTPPLNPSPRSVGRRTTQLPEELIGILHFCKPGSCYSSNLFDGVQRYGYGSVCFRRWFIIDRLVH